MAEVSGINGHSYQTVAQIDLVTITRALELVHNPSSNNKDRKQASAYLDDLKHVSGIARAGFALANDTNQQPVIRHYGLTLLEHVIKHQAFSLDEQSSHDLRRLVLELSTTLPATPQAYIRNKIAALWVELAKRSWALDWFELDTILAELWDQSMVHKQFVLSILENLSDDVFIRHDSTSTLRGSDLNDAIVEICTAATDYAGGLKMGGVVHKLRHGEEGWTRRITKALSEHLQHVSGARDQGRMSTMLLNTLRSFLSWIMTPAIADANTMATICQALTQRDSDVVMAAVDALKALYGRARLEHIEVVALVQPLCEPSSISALKKVYEWSIVGIDDILDLRYNVSKKLSEIFFDLTCWLTQHEPPSDLDLQPFLEFLITIAQHDSPIVSNAATHSWDLLLQSPAWRRSRAIQVCVEPALQVAMQRIVAYDQLPSAAEISAVMFVNEEIELFPERQGFYSSYRRSCANIVEWISYTFLEDALDYIITSVDKDLGQVIQAESGDMSSEHTRISTDRVRIEARFTALDAALRGLCRWMALHRGEEKSALSTKQHDIRQKIKSWTIQMLSQHQFQDPVITGKQMRFAVEVASKLPATDGEFAFSVLQHILSVFDPPRSNKEIFLEARPELHVYSIVELRKLCIKHVSHFISFYDQLETKITQVIDGDLDPKFRDDLRTIPMLLIEHADGIDVPTRTERLRSFIEPLRPIWESQGEVLASFSAFVRHEAFDLICPYIAKIDAMKFSDWTSRPLDTEAKEIQVKMEHGASTLPLRRTRLLLSTSTDGLEAGSELHSIVCQVWIPLLPTILRVTLQLLSYNHLLHDASSWPECTSEQYSTTQRILRDRYWQSGISGETMTDFHARVKATKNSLEGFASSIRGRIRANLENCYSIIHTLGRLGSPFYSLREIPRLIADQVINSATPLSLHHFGLLLSMLPKLIEECPNEDRAHFLPPILSSLLVQTDNKLTVEWQRLAQRGEMVTANGTNNGDFTDEMRDESVLRQTTTKAVTMVQSWLDPQRELKLATAKRIVNGSSSLSMTQTLRDFVLSSRAILEPLLLFCTHALAYRDIKSSGIIIGSMHKFVTAFSTDTYLSGSDANAVREYISSEMLKTAITSLHDGYFADNHQNLAVLIGLIWLAFGLPAHVPATETQPAHDRPAWTDTPRNVLLSIPGLTSSKIDAAAQKLTEYGLGGSGRRIRAVVLLLLEDVQGVRMSELGKFDTRLEKNGLLEKYKAREAMSMQGVEERKKGDEDGGMDFGGVADMFA